MSTFGGPDDYGVKPDEGLALVNDSNIGLFTAVLLPQQPLGTTGLARRLDPAAEYIACRWDYHRLPPEYLVTIEVDVTNLSNGRTLKARPVDWDQQPQREELPISLRAWSQHSASKQMTSVVWIFQYSMR